MSSSANSVPSRGTALWSALGTDELSLASSSNSSSVPTISSSAHRLLLPNTGNSHALLDDLLRDDGDNHHVSSYFQSQDAAADAAFFSLPEENSVRDHATAYASSSNDSMSSPASGGAPISTQTSNTRLLQLETNYERKKKRAKINRKDLNSRFMELMDILHLKEDRKLNRAKVLEKTIEHIEKLTAELRALKDGQGDQNQVQKPQRKAEALHQQQHLPVTGQRVLPGPVQGNAVAMMPFDSSQGSLWSAAAGASLPLAPMMWMPMVTPSGMMVKHTAPERPADSTSRKRSRGNTVKQASVDKAVAASTDISTSPTTPSSSPREVTRFVWIAQEIPTLLSYCDAWTLTTVTRTSRELQSAAQSDRLWDKLCRVRWRIPPSFSISQPRQQWEQWHGENRLPECGDVTPGGLLFASGQQKSICVWGLLSRRSNGHTTRTVLVNGKATVMQVVEVLIVVQNLNRGRVRLTDTISSTSSVEASSFQPFTAASGAHLTPQVVAFNGQPRASKDLGSMVLHHGDLCVLSVFLQCSGLELEKQFLERARCVTVQCALDVANGASPLLVNVHAACKALNRAREKALPRM